MKLKKDSAVSSVVAVILILVVLVIGVTLLMSTYIPDMKETSEIQNSQDIRGVFLNYAATVDNTYSTHEIGQYSWVIDLGAGDILISPSKSSGTIELTENTKSIFISSDSSGFLPLSIDCNYVDCTYKPVFSYWREVGYLYSKGKITTFLNSDSSSGVAYQPEYQTSKDGYWYGFDYVNNTVTVTCINFKKNTACYKSGSGSATITLKFTMDSVNEYTIGEGNTVSVNSQDIHTFTGDGILKIIHLNAGVSIL